MNAKNTQDITNDQAASTKPALDQDVPSHMTNTKEKSKNTTAVKENVTRTKKTTPFGLGGWLAVVACMSVLLLGAYNYWHHTQQHKQNQNQQQLLFERIKTVEHEQQQIAALSLQRKESLDQFAQELTNTDTRIDALEQTSQTHLEQAMDALRQEFAQSPETYSLTLAKQYIAHAQLALTTGIAPTIVLQQLLQAKNLVETTTGIDITQLHQALEADIATIQLMIQTEQQKRATIAMISAITNDIDTLAFIPNTTTIIEDQKNKPQDKKPQPQDWLDKLQQSVVNMFAELVTVQRRKDATVTIDLSLQEFMHIKRMVETQLHVAQLQLVKGDKNDFLLALEQTLHLIDTYLGRYPIHTLRSQIIQLTHTKFPASSLSLRSHTLYGEDR